MLNNTLNTNEIKGSAGTEIEFSRQKTVDRTSVFAKVDESPALPYRLTIAHQEIGTGLKKRRRSVVRFDKTVISDVDNVTPVTVSAYLVLDFPLGAQLTDDEATNVIANVLSFCATTGAATTVLFDGTGNGASALLTGGL